MAGYRNELAGAYAAIADDRHLTVFPPLREKIATLRARALLDYGGGDGSFVRSCAALSLARLATYDPSPQMTELSSRTLANVPVETIRNTAELPDGSFDVVTCNAVWMCWTTEAECVTNLSEIRRLLAPGGVLLSSVTHPCFRDRTFATYRTDFDSARYLEDGAAFRVTVYDGRHQVELEDTHWSLGAMTRQLRASRFTLTDIVEVADRGGAPGAAWMIVEARAAE